MGVLRTSKEILPYYLYSLLNLPYMRNKLRGSSAGTNIKNLSNLIGNIEIPVPPIEIQKNIEKECLSVDKEYQTTRMEIEIFNKLGVITANTGGG